MKKFLIEGPCKVKGTVNISGSKKIKFDFKSVNLISPAFADELIRKVKNTDPNIEIQWINSNETIDMMMSHFLKRL